MLSQFAAGALGSMTSVPSSHAPVRFCVSGLTHGAHFSLPVSEIHLRAWNKDHAWVLRTLVELAAEFRDTFQFLSVGAQDASRANHEFLAEFAQTARAAGLCRLRIADTVGILNPLQTAELFSKLRAATPDLSLEFHGKFAGVGKLVGRKPMLARKRVDAGAKQIVSGGAAQARIEAHGGFPFDGMPAGFEIALVQLAIQQGFEVPDLELFDRIAMFADDLTETRNARGRNENSLDRRFEMGRDRRPNCLDRAARRRIEFVKGVAGLDPVDQRIWRHRDPSAANPPAHKTRRFYTVDWLWQS